MNKDPLEELFGPLDETPEPVPARERLAFEQAERVRTAQLPADRWNAPKARAQADASGAPREGAGVPAKPWIIVGIVAVLAIVVSILVVNLARGQEEAAPAPTSTPSPAPTASPTPTPSPDPQKPEEEPEEDENAVPKVEVGETIPFPIGPWNATSSWPQRLGGASFEIPDNENLRLSGELFSSFPDSCAAMRTEWGVTKQANGTFEVAKPATKCEAAPELYDEVWGLLDAWAQSIKVN